ncbi:hypothetical protein AX15_005559 [Amanita polypyramis BW_CC]|nr:hypothetical protein AX15_005559 [Amanita polypyramis BW_CC]
MIGDDLTRTSPGSPISIQSLSSEILSEVFLHCLTAHETTRASIPPLLLCHICSRWRRVALGTPRLWRYLSLKPSTRYLSRDVVERRLIRLAGFYMDNAKDCTVSLHLELTRAGSWAPESENNWRGLCNELLIRFIGRYHSISLQAPGFALTQLGAFSFLSPGQIQYLESLKLHVRSAHWDGVISLFSSAPRLRRIIFGLQDGYVMDGSWSSISQHFSPSLLPLPWGQLTHFCLLMSITVPVWHSLLPQLQSLEQCVIILDAGQHGESELVRLSNTPIILPNLTTLNLTLIARDRPASFHEAEMPQLKKLHLSSLFPMDISTLQWQEHIDALRNLTSFCAHRVGIDSYHLLDVLGAMDQLNELALSCDLRDYDVILKAMTIDDITVAPLVPHLQKFRLHVAFGRNAHIQFTPETFVRMVQSRWQIPATMNRLLYVRLGIFGGDFLVAGIGSVLAPLVQEGLAFEVSQEQPLPYPSDADITRPW